MRKIKTLDYNGYTIPLTLNALDLIYTIEGYKPVTRIIIADTQINNLFNFCRGNNLFWKIESYRVLRNSDKGKGGFSNRLEHVEYHNENGDYIVYISIDKKILNNNFNKMSEKEFGQYLGYPECCTEFYEKNKHMVIQEQIDLAPLSVTSLGPFLYYANYFLRYFNYSVISHFPCSCNCKETVAYGKRNMKLLRRLFPDFANEMELNMCSFILYTENYGITYITNYEIKKSVWGQHIVFKTFYSTNNQSEIYRYLNKYKEFNIIDFNKIKIGNKIFCNNQLRVASFNKKSERNYF